MDRREFSKRMLMAGAGLGLNAAPAVGSSGDYYEEPAKRLPIRTFDVVVARVAWSRRLPPHGREPGPR